MIVALKEGNAAPEPEEALPVEEEEEEEGVLEDEAEEVVVAPSSVEAAEAAGE